MELNLSNADLLAGIILKLVQLIVVALIVVPASILLWQASTSSEIVFEPIRAPSDMAEQGIDSVVVASRLLDKLNESVGNTDVYSSRTPLSTIGDWDGHAAVEIPGTGISMDQLTRLLREWFGNELRVSGELYTKDNSQLAMTVRVNGRALPEIVGKSPTATKHGADIARPGVEDLDELLKNGALAILKATQPYHYAIALGSSDCNFSSKLFKGAPHCGFLEEAANDDSNDTGTRAWIYTKLAERLMAAGFYREGINAARKATRLDGSNPMPDMAIAVGYEALGDPENALHSYQVVAHKLSGSLPRDLSHERAAIAALGEEAGIAELTGAFDDAAAYKIRLTGFDNRNLVEFEPASVSTNYAREFDIGDSQSWLQRSLNSHFDWPKNDGASIEQFETVQYALPTFFELAARGDWKKAERDLEEADEFPPTDLNDIPDVELTFIRPWLSYARAMNGDIKAAEALISTTPQNCYLCLMMRGAIAGMEGNISTAASWFERATKFAPSVPFAYEEWGRILFAKGDFDGAIGKFRMASEKGPHYADPLENWGEALMRQNRSDLALAEFANAEKYAPKWGRLHLRWGEALHYAGQDENAREQFTIAATLYLSSADRSELMQQTTRIH